MSDNRKLTLDCMYGNAGNCKVELITTKNISDYILPEVPLHEAYEYLSFTHRADCLRAYMMNFYGGGYSDIKRCRGSWEPYFDMLSSRTDKFCIGYEEDGPWKVGFPPEHPNPRELQNNYKKLIGNGGYIHRKKTPLTIDWMETISRILDRNLNMLKKHPGHYHPRAISGGIHDGDRGSEKTHDDTVSRAAHSGSKYPLRWAEICGEVFHPIAFVYADKILRDLPHPHCVNYR